MFRHLYNSLAELCKASVALVSALGYLGCFTGELLVWSAQVLCALKYLCKSEDKLNRPNNRQRKKRPTYKKRRTTYERGFIRSINLKPNSPVGHSYPAFLADQYAYNGDIENNEQYMDSLQEGPEYVIY